MLATRGVLLMEREPHQQATPGGHEGAMAYIRRVREELGIQSKVVAAALGMAANQYSSMEGNRKPGYLPSPDKLAIICDILRITQAEVIRAAGYLTDDAGVLRLDDRGDDWSQRQDAIGADLGPEQLQRIADRISQTARQAVIDELQPVPLVVERQQQVGGR